MVAFLHVHVWDWMGWRSLSSLSDLGIQDGARTYHSRPFRVHIWSLPLHFTTQMCMTPSLFQISYHQLSHPTSLPSIDIFDSRSVYQKRVTTSVQTFSQVIAKEIICAKNVYIHSKYTKTWYIFFMSKMMRTNLWIVLIRFFFSSPPKYPITKYHIATSQLCLNEGNKWS